MILFLSAYPPRECGLAAYTYHLLEALKEHFDSRSLSFGVCALEEGCAEKRLYPDDVRYTLKTADAEACRQMAHLINRDKTIQAVCIQHRFGQWGGGRWGENINVFLEELEKPVSVALHNVLPEPEDALLELVRGISRRADLLVVQTRYHASQLAQYYGVEDSKIRIIPPGAPVVPPYNKEELKKKHKLDKKLVLTSFGYLRRSKGLEHVLEALDLIRKDNPEVIYLILGKTHPIAARYEGERYRIQLKDLIFRKGLQKHVRFVNRQLEQQELEEFICLSDVYLHTSKTSIGSLVLAGTCGVPVITPQSPVTAEYVQDHARVADFHEPMSLVKAIRDTLKDKNMQERDQREEASSHPYLWPNIALAYQEVFGALVPMHVRYTLPLLKPDHFYRLTTTVGLLNADKQTNPLSRQAYLLKDNAKGLIAALLWYRSDSTHELLLLMLMRRFLNVIRRCQQANGTFLSQLDEQGDYMPEAQKQYSEVCSMQAMWALSKLYKRSDELPADMPALAQRMFMLGLPHVAGVSSPRAIAFAIKALYQYYEAEQKDTTVALIDTLACRLQEAYEANSTKDFHWFEPQLGEDNSLLPEAMLLAWQASGHRAYKVTAHRSFRFLLSRMFTETAAADEQQEVDFMNEERFVFSDRPLEVCFTIMALNLFYQQTGDQAYVDKMFAAFSWFMGNNELHQTLYNPATGGCYDGIRNGKISQQQGAECLVSYLLSRLTLERFTLQAVIQHQPSTPAPKLSVSRGLEIMQDRPSISSGHVKVLAN